MISWLLALLLVAAAVLAATRRRHHRILHGSTTLLAGLCLAWLALAPAEETTADRLLIVTPGASEGQVAAAVDRAFPVVDLDPSRNWNVLHPGLPFFADPESMRRTYPSISRVEVLGQGLAEERWEGLDIVAWQGSEQAPTGPRTILWDRQIQLGQEVAIRGLFEGGEGDDELRLVAPDGSVQERPLPPGEPLVFSFRQAPKAEGLGIYRLESSSGSWPLEVDVLPPPELQILWLEGAPTYEARFALDLFRHAGHSVAVRHRISRDRFQTEVHGLGEISLRPLAPDLLRHFDLVIVDLRALGGLSRSERSSLEEAVRDEGVGLLVLASSSFTEDPDPRDLLAGLRVVPVEGVDRLQIRPAWPGREASTTLAIPALRLETGESWRPWVEDATGRELTALRSLGEGRIAVTLLTTTHLWPLRGEKASSQQLWERRLSTLLRPADVQRIELPQNAPVLVDRRLDFAVVDPRGSPSAEVVGPSGEVIPLALRQDPLALERFSGSFWPREEGLHLLRIGQASLAFAAHEDASFEAFLAARRGMATRARLARAPAMSARDRRPPFHGPALFLLAVLLLAVSWVRELV